MKSYLNLVNRVLTEGELHSNRTDYKSYRIIGAMIEHHMSDGFPLLTTRQIFYKGIFGEILGFIRGYTNSEQFKKLGCIYWDSDANENIAWLKNPNRKGTGDLGRIYGAQWRCWQTAYPDNPNIDQLNNALLMVINDPDSRRNIVQSWNPADLSYQALPACHTSFQLVCHKEEKKIDIVFNMRSTDIYHGLPANIAGYALLLTLICQITEYTPGKVVGLLADLHYYENQKENLLVQLEREPLKLPKLSTYCWSMGYPPNNPAIVLGRYDPLNLVISDYKYHPPLPAVKMANSTISIGK